MPLKKKRAPSIKRDSYVLRCFGCKASYPIDDYGKFYRCNRCSNLLEVKRVDKVRKSSGKALKLGVWKYLDLIPLWSERNIVSLSEGGTNLVECKNLEKLFGLNHLYVKFEGQNPTASFKDRGMTVGISKAVELGFKKVMCASTGNTSASLAAYSARANLHCMVLIPKGKIAMGKIAQALAYGAEILQVDGNFDDSLRVASELCETNHEILLLNSLNPFRIEGQKTTSFEIVEQLSGRVPDYVILPVGNGGNITSVWKGFTEIFEDGLEEIVGPHKGRKLPKIFGIQAEGAAPIARAFMERRFDSIVPVLNPHTEASAINIGSPVSWMKALAAIRDSKGGADIVSDDEIFLAQKLLASKEGLFVEPASATPIAYLTKICRTGEPSDEYHKMKDATIICIATGNGLKDPNALLKQISPESLKTIPADARSLETVLTTQ